METQKKPTKKPANGKQCLNKGNKYAFYNRQTDKPTSNHETHPPQIATTEAIKNGAETMLKVPVTFENIIDCAKKGDKLCSDTLDIFCKYLAIGVTNAINIFDPAVVILGNDIATGGDEIISRLKKNVGITPIGSKHHSVDIIMSKFYDKAPLLGAATVVFDKIMFA